MRRRTSCLWLLIQLVACGSDSSKGGSVSHPDGSSPADAATAPDSGRPQSGAKDAGSNAKPDAAVSGNSGRSGSAGTSAATDAGKPTTPSNDAGVPPTSNDASTNPTADDDAGAVPNTCVGQTKFDAFVSDPKLCVYVFAENVARARQMAFAPNGDLFVSSAGLTVLWDANHDGVSDDAERARLSAPATLNHGVVFSPDAKWLYASSSTTVYRWAYTMGQRTLQTMQVVIDGMPDGGHATRTLAFDSQGRLIVSIGSASNVDTSQSDWDTRSQIRRYVIPESLPASGLPYLDGTVIASGMRNEVGVFVDTDDRIWGVENGRDNLSDADFGGDIHIDNPAEEINLIDGAGPTFYGYPFCFSEFALSAGGGGPGTQWADEELNASIRKTDAYCKDAAQVRAPAGVMPAHWAPLGVIRYRGRALPMDGDLIIGAHGSWNREPATGRVVARARVEGSKVTAVEVIVGEKNGVGELRQGTWSVRPVDVRQGPDDAVYVSDDTGNRVLKIGYAR